MWTHPRQQFRLLCTRACVLRHLRGEAWPNRRARAVGGAAEKELASLGRLLRGALLRALGDPAISRPTVLFACAREEAVRKISERT
jgi:hypothetical protein